MYIIMNFVKEAGKQIKNIFKHPKLNTLLLSVVVFSLIYTILDDKHFSGVNVIKEKIKEEVIKKKIEKEVGEPEKPANESFVGIFNGGYLYAPNSKYEIFETYPFLKITPSRIDKKKFNFNLKDIKDFFQLSGNKVKKIEKLIREKPEMFDHADATTPERIAAAYASDEEWLSRYNPETRALFERRIAEEKARRRRC